MDSKLKQFIINTLRRASYRWPPRFNTMNKARVERGKYRCNLCQNIHRRKDVSLDHINPVVNPVKGFEGFDIYIERMFVGEAGWQVLCKECHNGKTNQERVLRKKK